MSTLDGLNLPVNLNELLDHSDDVQTTGKIKINAAISQLANMSGGASDAYVNAAILTETTRAETAESTNATAITTETTRAEAAESTNATAITNETTRAEAVEATKVTVTGAPVVSGHMAVFSGTTGLIIHDGGAPTASTTLASLTDVSDHANGFDLLLAGTVPSAYNPSAQGGGGSYSNAVFGYGALTSATTCIYNTVIGAQAMVANTIGSGNVAIGRVTLNSNVSGNGLTGVGTQALFIATGNFNTGIGYNAGPSITSGTNNTLLGASSDLASGTITNATAIGYTAVAPADNTVQLGNTSVTDVYCGTPSTTVLHANGFAGAVTATITTAALTGGGTQGSMTFTNGILTAQTPAT